MSFKLCIHILNQIAWGAVCTMIAAITAFYILQEGRLKIQHAFHTLEISVDRRVENLFLTANYLIIPVFVVFVYGQREIVRRYDHKCFHKQHIVERACVAAIVKPIIGSVLIFTAACCLVMLIFAEGVYIYFLCLDYTCKGTVEQGRALQPILDLMGSELNLDDDAFDSSNTIYDVCKSLRKGIVGCEMAFAALIIILCFYISVLGYWMKYSTIGAAPEIPFHPDFKVPEQGYREYDDGFYKKKRTYHKRRSSTPNNGPFSINSSQQNSNKNSFNKNNSFNNNNNNNKTEDESIELNKKLEEMKKLAKDYLKPRHEIEVIGSSLDGTRSESTNSYSMDSPTSPIKNTSFALSSSTASFSEPTMPPPKAPYKKESKKAPYKDEAMKKASFKEEDNIKKAPYKDEAMKKASFKEDNIKKAPYKDEAMKKASFKEEDNIKKAPYKDEAMKKASFKEEDNIKKAPYKDEAIKNTPSIEGDTTLPRPAKGSTPRSASKEPRRSSTPQAGLSRPAKGSTPRSASKEPRRSSTPRVGLPRPVKGSTPRSASKEPRRSSTPRAGLPEEIEKDKQPSFVRESSPRRPSPVRKGSSPSRARGSAPGARRNSSPISPTANVERV